MVSKYSSGFHRLVEVLEELLGECISDVAESFVAHLVGTADSSAFVRSCFDQSDLVLNVDGINHEFNELRLCDGAVLFLGVRLDDRLHLFRVDSFALEGLTLLRHERGV